jgi:thiol:disulfide interchange protein
VEKAKATYSERIPFAIYDIDTKAGKAMLKTTKIDGVPTLFFVNKNGATVKKIVGSCSKAMLDRNVQSLLK